MHCVTAALEKAAVQSGCVLACVVRRDRRVKQEAGCRYVDGIDKPVRTLWNRVIASRCPQMRQRPLRYLQCNATEPKSSVAFHWTAAPGRMQKRSGRCAPVLPHVHREIQETVSSWVRSRIKGGITAGAIAAAIVHYAGERGVMTERTTRTRHQVHHFPAQPTCCIREQPMRNERTAQCLASRAMPLHPRRTRPGGNVLLHL